VGGGGKARVRIMFWIRIMVRIGVRVSIRVGLRRNEVPGCRGGGGMARARVKVD